MSYDRSTDSRSNQVEIVEKILHILEGSFVVIRQNSTDADAFSSSSGISISSSSSSSNIQYRPSDYPGILDTDLTSLTITQRRLFTVIVSVLFFLSLCGNIGTLCVNFRRKMRPFFRACLISLALSDLLSTIFQATAYLAQFSVEYVQIWRLGDVMCNLVPFATTAAILVSSSTLVGIALDRYFAVMKAVIAFWNPGFIFCVICIFGIWAVSIAIASPVFYLYHIISIYILTEERIVPNSSDGDNSGQMTTTDWQAEASEEDLSYTLVKQKELVHMCISDKKDVALYYIIVFSIIFIPCIILFVWLNSIIARTIWIRRHASRNSTKKGHKLKKTKGQVKHRRNCDVVELRQQVILQINPNTNSSHSNGPFKYESKVASTMKTTSKVSNATNATNTTTNDTRQSRHLRMFSIIILLMTVFLFLRLPAWIFLVMRMYGNYTKPVDWIVYFSFGILNLGSCVLNPLFYTFLPETIQYLSCCKMRFCGKVTGLRGQCSKRPKNFDGESEELKENTDSSCLDCGLLCGNFQAGATSENPIDAPEKVMDNRIAIDCELKSNFPNLENDEGVDCSDSSFDENEDEIDSFGVIGIFTVFSDSLVSFSTMPAHRTTQEHNTIS